MSAILACGGRFEGRDVVVGREVVVDFEGRKEQKCFASSNGPRVFVSKVSLA